jgi:hypothetical protein
MNFLRIIKSINSHVMEIIYFSNRQPFENYEVYVDYQVFKKLSTFSKF